MGEPTPSQRFSRHVPSLTHENSCHTWAACVGMSLCIRQSHCLCLGHRHPDSQKPALLKTGKLDAKRSTSAREALQQLHTCVNLVTGKWSNLEFWAPPILVLWPTMACNHRFKLKVFDTQKSRILRSLSLSECRVSPQVSLAESKKAKSPICHYQNVCRQQVLTTHTHTLYSL